MKKELEKQAKLELVKRLGHVFFNRTDEYAIQTPEGSYYLIPRQVTQRLLVSHLKGNLTLGTYVLSSQ